MELETLKMVLRIILGRIRSPHTEDRKKMGAEEERGA